MFRYTLAFTTIQVIDVTSVFVSVIAVVFYNVFHSKMYQNIFFKKILFLISTYQNDLKTLKNINLKKKNNFFLNFLNMILKHKNKQGSNLLESPS
jgi:Na+/H+ antiporter NhaC